VAVSVAVAVAIAPVASVALLIEPTIPLIDDDLAHACITRDVALVVAPIAIVQDDRAEAALAPVLFRPMVPHVHPLDHDDPVRHSAVRDGSAVGGIPVADDHPAGDRP